MCNCAEEWKRIDGSWYAISNKGRIYSKATKTILKQSLNKDGYPRVIIKKISPSAICTHRLVAKFFVDNPDKLPTVDHIDSDKANNCFCNLVWMTFKDNVIKGRCRSYKLTSPSGEVFIISNLAKFCKENNLCKSNLTKVAKGRKTPYKGWYAEYQ